MENKCIAVCFLGGPPMGVPLYACELHNIVVVYIEVCRVIIWSILSEI